MSGFLFSQKLLTCAQVVENTNYTNPSHLVLRKHPLPSTMSYVDLLLHDHQIPGLGQSWCSKFCLCYKDKDRHIPPRPFRIPDSIPDSIPDFIPSHISECACATYHCTYLLSMRILDLKQNFCSMISY